MRNFRLIVLLVISSPLHIVISLYGENIEERIELFLLGLT